ncbi:hypothetical protein, partial [Stutzerimonas stutzeri]|uniref:hypothetical protein n=1 Tax=Stutzerimonas stutzeri TaxID=316 RepID=UPI001BB078E1
TNRVPEPGAGSGTAANIKGSVTRSRDNYLENRRVVLHMHWILVHIDQMNQSRLSTKQAPHK